MKLNIATLSTISFMGVNCVAADPSRISHIIVLMMENRSFDHMLGWLSDFDPKINGLSKNMSTPRNPFDLT